MASSDSVAGLLSEVWKCLGLLRFPLCLCVLQGSKPELWVVLLVGVSRKLTQRWRVVCRKVLRECFGGRPVRKGGKASRTG